MQFIPKALLGLVSFISMITLGVVSWLSMGMVGLTADMAVMRERVETLQQGGSVPVWWQKQVEANQEKNMKQDDVITDVLIRLKGLDDGNGD